MAMLRTLVFLLPLQLLLSGCVSVTFDRGRSETVLPVSKAWIDGRQVEYITTDVSDEAMATMLGVNFVPRLAEAARAQPGQSLLERVYKFPNNEQESIFQSAPSPAGASNKDASYSPLWRVVMVRWNPSKPVRTLRSEEQLLAAVDSGEVKIEVTGVVVNCPVTRDAQGKALKGVR